MRRNAILVASSIEVLCPHCGEGQPNPDNGAFPWTPEEVAANQGAKECVSCEQKFWLVTQSRVSVNPALNVAGTTVAP